MAQWSNLDWIHFNSRAIYVHAFGSVLRDLLHMSYTIFLGNKPGYPGLWQSRWGDTGNTNQISVLTNSPASAPHFVEALVRSQIWGSTPQPQVMLTYESPYSLGTRATSGWWSSYCCSAQGVLGAWSADWCFSRTSGALPAAHSHLLPHTPQNGNSEPKYFLVFPIQTNKIQQKCWQNSHFPRSLF